MSIDESLGKMAEWDMEAIVKEVLRRIAQLSAPSAPSPSPARNEQERTNHRELRLHDRVVTLALLDGKLEGVNRIVLPPNAIVTPAVRDELRLRKIDWQRANKASQNGASIQPTGTLPLLLASEDAAVDTREWNTKLNSSEVIAAGDAGAIASRFATWVDDRHLAIAWSRRPLRLACRLNKHANIRAVAVVTEKDVTQGVDEVGANVFVFDSRERNPAWLAWIERFRTGVDRREPL